MLPNKKKLLQLDFKIKNKNSSTLEKRLILRKLTENDLKAIYNAMSSTVHKTYKTAKQWFKSFFGL